MIRPSIILVVAILAAACAAPVESSGPQATEFALSIKQTQVAYDASVVAYIATKDHLERVSTQEAANSFGAARATQTATIADAYVYPTRVVVETNRAASRARALTVTLWVLGPGLSLVFLFFLIVLISLKWHRNAPVRPPRIIDGSFALGPPIDDNDTTAKVLDFLRAAISVAGSYSEKIPGHRELPGYQSGSRWSENMRVLSRAGAVVTVSGSGSRVRQPYKTLGRLYNAVLHGSVKVAPLPIGSQIDLAQQNGSRTEQETEQ